MMKRMQGTASPSLVIRESPGAGKDTGLRVMPGESVVALGQTYDGTWTFVAKGGRFGWCSSQFLKPETPAPAASSLVVTSRASWGSLYTATQRMAPGAKDLVVVHHFAVPDVPFDATINEEEAAMRAVERHHVEKNGWKALGYSFVIFASGRIYQGRDWGFVGAHTPGKNSSAHGIAFAINGEAHALTSQAIASFRALVAGGVRAGWVASDWSIAGHRDYDDTRCPGDRVYGQLPALRGN